jgi:hypothetical protein
MSEAINDRPGAWLSEGNWVYTLQHAGWRRGEEQFENRLVAQVHPGRSSSLSEATQIASLFAEAGTVHHETGLTPRQLVEQRDALAAALEGCAQDLRDVTSHFHVHPQSVLGKNLAKARAALALVKGATP